MALTKIGKEGVTGISNSSDATAITIDSSENVGISTSSPTKKVSASIGLNDTDGYVLEYSGDAKGGILLNPASGEVRMGAINSSGTYLPTFYSNNTEYLRIASTGKVQTSNRNFGFFNHGTNVSLADDASIVINGSVAGSGLLAIYETASGHNALFRVGYLSTSFIVSNSDSSFSNADTDGLICVFASSHTITIKNRLGSTRAFSISMFMAGNTFAG